MLHLKNKENITAQRDKFLNLFIESIKVQFNINYDKPKTLKLKYT